MKKLLLLLLIIIIFAFTIPSFRTFVSSLIAGSAENASPAAAADLGIKNDVQNYLDKAYIIPDSPKAAAQIGLVESVFPGLISGKAAIATVTLGTIITLKTSTAALLLPVALPFMTISAINDLFANDDAGPARKARESESSYYGKCLNGKILVVSLMNEKNKNIDAWNRVKDKGQIAKSEAQVNDVKSYIWSANRKRAELAAILKAGTIQTGVNPFGGQTPTSRVLENREKEEYRKQIADLDANLLVAAMKIIDNQIKEARVATDTACNNYCPALDVIVENDTEHATFLAVRSTYNKIKATSGASSASIDAAKANLNKAAGNSIWKAVGKIDRYYQPRLSAFIKARNAAQGSVRWTQNINVARFKTLIGKEVELIKEFKGYLATNTLDKNTEAKMNSYLARAVSGYYVADPSYAICKGPAPITPVVTPPPPQTDPRTPVGPNPPTGSTTPPVITTCVSNPRADLSGRIFLPNKATITNDSNNCSYTVGLASYKKLSDDINTQILIDSETKTVGPHQSVSLDVETLSTCAYQIDLFYGNTLQSFKGGVRYGTRLLAALPGNGTRYCTATGTTQ